MEAGADAGILSAVDGAAVADTPVAAWWKLSESALKEVEVRWNPKAEIQHMAEIG